MSIKAPFVWDIFEENKKNGLNTYIVAIFIYTDSAIERDHYWVTEFCARIAAKEEKADTTSFSPCSKFNKHYYSDKTLSEVTN